jgi:hypothetical protein
VVEGWFSGPDHEELRGLESLRHVLVHRGGRADKSFLGRIKDHPVFSRLAEGAMVPLDGVMVGDYVDASIRRAPVLIGGVDEWLSTPE